MLRGSSGFLCRRFPKGIFRDPSVACVFAKHHSFQCMGAMCGDIMGSVDVVWRNVPLAGRFQNDSMFQMSAFAEERRAVKCPS